MDNLLPETFFFDLPLYTKIKITDDNQRQFIELLQIVRKIDGYNPFIKEKTTFSAYGFLHGSRLSHFIANGGTEQLSIKCLRSDEIFTFYIFYNEEDSIFMKIGQYPSIADFHINQIKKYNKVLSQDWLKELARAIGLAANGIGIGSFVYLRRIFENLIEEAHQKVISKDNWDEDLFKKQRMGEKIELLKDNLPDFLVEHKSLYGILSVGIHSLKEEDCLAYFETVKVGIELILDEKLEAFLKQQKLDEAKLKLTNLTSKIPKK